MESLAVHDLNEDGVSNEASCKLCGAKFVGKQILKELVKVQTFEFDKEHGVPTKMYVCNDTGGYSI